MDRSGQCPACAAVTHGPDSHGAARLRHPDGRHADHVTAAQARASPGIGTAKAPGRRVADVLGLAEAPSRCSRIVASPSVTIELHITGQYGDVTCLVVRRQEILGGRPRPLRLTYGERLRLVLVNDTMMEPSHSPTRYVDACWKNGAGELSTGAQAYRRHVKPGSKRS